MLIFVSAANMSAMAFSLKKDKNNPLKYSEKITYVNTDFIERFGDEYLLAYVREAVENNHDARKASWQVEEYRQNVKYSFGRELPSLSVGANYLGLHIPDTSGLHIDNNAFLLPFIASYEPDFLLKNRDKTRSVKKAYEASKFEEKAVYISLVSDVAALYINILQYDSLIESQKSLIAIKQLQLEKEQKKFDRGVIDNMQLNAYKKDMETLKNRLENLYKQRDTALNSFAVLIGRPPDAKAGLERGKLQNFEYQGVIPKEIESDVIFARPDVMASEANLEKANIDVRVARKEFLPSFNIIGLLTFNTVFPGSFFSWNNSIAAILAGATQDIFKGGMKVAQLNINKARYEQLFEDYGQTNLNAVKEVNTALCVIKFDTKVDQNAITKLNLQEKDFGDVKKKFERGMISVTDLVNEKEKVENIRQEQVQTKTTRLVNYLTLYKAVGGKL